MTPTQLCERIMRLKREEAALANERKRFEAELVQLKDNELKAALDKDYGTGSKSFTEGDYKLRITVPKRVDWDQETLGLIAQNIAASGDSITNYAATKYEIKETHYNAWPSYIKKAFEPARTVKAGNPIVAIEEINQDV